MFKGSKSKLNFVVNKTKTSRQQGQQVEAFVRNYLEQKQLLFVGQNFHSRYGEIDLIFIEREKLEQKCLVFVEVRYRANNKHGTGAESVSYHKQQKIIKTAQFFLQKERKYSQLNARFDVVSVSLENGHWQPVWQRNAFQANAW